MSQIQDFQRAFEPCLEYFNNETKSSIDIETDIQNLRANEITRVLEFAHENERFFEDFEVVIQSNTIREVEVISLRGGLRSSEAGFNELNSIADIPLGDRVVDELVEGGEFDTLTENLMEWEDEEDFNFSLDLIVSKTRIQQVLEQTEGFTVPSCIHVWTNIDALQGWLESNQGGYEDIDSLFPSDEYPIFFILWGDSPDSDGPLLFLKRTELSNRTESYEGSYNQYRELMDQASSLIKSSSDIPVVSPLLFNTTELRELFSTIFLYSVLASVSEDVRLLGSELSFHVEAGSRTVSDQMSPEDIEEQAQSKTDAELENLYDFYTEFSAKGTNKTYREFWHQSIIHTVNSLLDIPTQRDDIENHYEFLEREAIEQNFSDLSDAIQDAHTFTAEVTSTVSESTTNLTSEIQKVVLTLLGAIFANIFLILRWSDISMVLPFSIFVIAGILLFYFPTIETRINQLDTIVAENDEDFEVYSEAIQDFSGELFDFSEFKERRDSYITYANEQKAWAIESLELTFTVLILTWTLLAVVSILFFGFLSRQFIAATASVPVVLLIAKLQSDAIYYPTSFETLTETLNLKINWCTSRLNRVSPVQILVEVVIASILFKIVLTWYWLLP